MDIQTTTEKTAIEAVVSTDKFNYQLRYEIADKAISSLTAQVQKNAQSVGNAGFNGGYFTQTLVATLSVDDKKQITEDFDSIYVQINASLNPKASK